MMRRIEGLAIATCFALASCVTTSPALRREAEVLLAAPATVGADFHWRQRIELEYGGRTRVFDAVLEKRGDRMVLVGLAPVGGSLLTVELEGGRVTAGGPLAEALPFSPRYLLRDVQRCYFPVFGEPGPWDGARTLPRAGELVTEIWGGGRLLLRSFRSITGGGRTRISYGPPRGDGGYESVDLVDEARGYRLSISTR